MLAIKQKRRPAYQIILALALGLALPTFAQSPPPVPASGPPDVLVLVYQRPGIGDQVDITYPRAVPHAQAQRDVSALAQTAGWLISGTRISDGIPPVQGQSRIGIMTSAAFVAPNVVDNTTHTFPLEAFIHTFRAYKSLRLIFVVSSGFTFQGIRNYADHNVQIALDQHGSAYTYQIGIFNPQWDRLSLPQTASAVSKAGSARRSPLLFFLGILGAAAVTGVVVYLVMARLTATPEKDAEETDEKLMQEETREEPKIGTKG